MSLVNQIRHDLLTRAKLSTPEVDTLLAHPELAAAGNEPTPLQAALQGILGESLEPAVLQAALGTFERDLNRPAGNESEVEPDVLASETIVSDLETQPIVTESTVSEPLPPLE